MKHGGQKNAQYSTIQYSTIGTLYNINARKNFAHAVKLATSHSFDTRIQYPIYDILWHRREKSRVCSAHAVLYRAPTFSLLLASHGGFVHVNTYFSN